MPTMIWKFALRPWPTPIWMQEGAKVLSVGAQGDGIVAWALCDPAAPLARRVIGAVPTGACAPVEPFVGTVQMDNGSSSTSSMAVRADATIFPSLSPSLRLVARLRRQEPSRARLPPWTTTPCRPYPPGSAGGPS